MAKKSYASKQQKRAMNAICGGAAAVGILLLCFLVYCMFKVETAEDLIESCILIALALSLVLFCIRNFLPAKKRRAIVQDMGINRIGTSINTTYVLWVDVKINNRIKRWYLDNDDLYHSIQRRNTYIFFLKRRTVENIQSYKENCK